MIEIARNLHFMWSQGRAAAPEQIRDTPERWQALNPTSHIWFWDKYAIEKLIRDYYPSFWLFYDELGRGQPGNVATIKKCDFARLLILFHYGGMYADMDCIPLKPLSHLFDGCVVKHRRTSFQYSRDGSLATVLGDDPRPDKTPFKNYEMVLSREHCQVEALKSYNYGKPQYALANTVMFSVKQNPDLMDLLAFIQKRAKMKVLEFAGPWALTRWALESQKRLVGRLCVLPPFYFLLQPHDMGKPWKDTISLHLNRMDWVDHSKQAGWLD